VTDQWVKIGGDCLLGFRLVWLNHLLFSHLSFDFTFLFFHLDEAVGLLAADEIVFYAHLPFGLHQPQQSHLFRLKFELGWILRLERSLV